MNLIVITPHYAPDFGPSTPIFTALCEDLAQMGVNVTVITGYPHYGGSEQIFERPKKLISEEMRNGVRVIRTYVYTAPKSSLSRRMIYHASYNLFSTLATFRVRKPDMILADAPTLWSGLPLVVKSIIGRVPFIYIVHDIYPDVLSRLGVVSNQKILDFVGKVENYFYSRSGAISVLSQGFEDNLTGKGVSADKIAIIPACVDTDFIQPLPKVNKYTQEWGLEDKFVMLYAGNMGFSQGLEVAVRAAEKLQDHPEIDFIFVGEGAAKPDLEALVDELKLKNVRFFPFLPREEVPLLYALADANLVSLKPELVAESVPSKTYTIMASGRPILAVVDDKTEVARLLEQAQCGLRIEPGNPDRLAEAILKLAENPSMRQEMGARGRSYVVENLSRQVATRAYYDLVTRLTTKGK